MRFVPQATAADWRTDRNWLAIGFITPAVALVVVLLIYKVIDAFDVSLHATQFANRLNFTGQQNYADLLRDKTIWRDAINSLVYTVGSLVLVIPYSMGV